MIRLNVGRHWVLLHTEGLLNFFLRPPNCQDVLSQSVDGLFVDAVRAAVGGVDPHLGGAEHRFLGQALVLQPGNDALRGGHYAAMVLRALQKGKNLRIGACHDAAAGHPTYSNKLRETGADMPTMVVPISDRTAPSAMCKDGYTCKNKRVNMTHMFLFIPSFQNKEKNESNDCLLSSFTASQSNVF